MNREIKFRAWCKYANGYVMDYDPYGDEYSCEGTPINDLFTQKAQESLNQILMQYTGLKDKNGVEIYEGDIVKGEWIQEVVSWQDDTSGFYPFADSPENCGHCGGGTSPMSVDVIGNIHENPELL